MNISAIRQRLAPSISLSDSRRSRRSSPEPREQGDALTHDGPLATAVREPDLHCAPPPTLAGKFRERKAIGEEKLRVYGERPGREGRSPLALRSSEGAEVLDVYLLKRFLGVERLSQGPSRIWSRIISLFCMKKTGRRIV